MLEPFENQNGWWFKDEEGYMRGPFFDRTMAENKLIEHLEKRYARPCEGDLVESKE